MLLPCYNPRMNNAPAAHHSRRAALAVVVLAALALVACLPAAPGAQPTASAPAPELSATPSATRPAAPTAGPTPSLNPNLPWQAYAGPLIEPVTPVPSPVGRYTLPPEVQVGILLGTARSAPYVGRTDAMLLMFYNEQLGRASLLSIPADLFVYLPGYTMQRLQVAYAVGGIQQVQEAIEYNFGVRPLRFALIHPEEVAGLVSRLDVLYLDVPADYSEQCKGLDMGRKRMTAKDVQCYVTFRVGMDELDRNRRQQDVLYNIFRRMTQSGKLALLPDIYQTAAPHVESNYTFGDLMGYVPLALQLGDGHQLGLFRFQQADLILWDIPGQLGGQGFLPRPGAIPSLVQRAVEFVLVPQRPGSIVQTLAYELTASPSPTITPTPTRTATRFPTNTRTLRPRTPTHTRTPTRTRTATVEATPEATSTPEE